jgi:KaiC/GvpD/RAD55 family RecA-like ATPase
VGGAELKLGRLGAAAREAREALEGRRSAVRLYAALARRGGSAEALQRLLARLHRVWWGFDPVDWLDAAGAEPVVPSPSGSPWGRTVLASMVKLLTAMKAGGMLRNLTLVLEGAKGSGKTTYAFNSCWQALADMGVGFREAYEQARRLTFWDLENWALAVKELTEQGRWVPFMILDDVGVHASRYWHLTSRRSAFIRIAEQLDTLKDVTGALVITTPDIRNIASFLRSSTGASGYVATFKQVRVGGGAATLIVWSTVTIESTGSRVKRVEAPAYLELIPVNTRMPDEVWETMMRVRAQDRLERITELLQATAEEEEGEGEEELGSDLLGEL